VSNPKGFDIVQIESRIWSGQCIGAKLPTIVI